MQRDYKYIIYILIAFSLFSLYYIFIELPNKNISTLAVFALLLYPVWRRKTPNPNLSTYLLYALSTFWIYEAWYRLEHSLLISYRYYSNIPPQHVAFETALLGASPFIVLALVLLVDEFFITRHIKKYFYNIDALDSQNLRSQQKVIQKILKEGNTITFYSTSGIEKAKEKAKELALKDKDILFATKDEIDAKPQEYIHIAKLQKI